MTQFIQRISPLRQGMIEDMQMRKLVSCTSFREIFVLEFLAAGPDHVNLIWP